VAGAPNLLDAARARELLSGAWPAPVRERVALGDAAGRFLLAAVTAGEDFPSVARAAMDGYAVAAIATRGATAATPVSLAMGTQAWPIATGGVMPAGADAVVMIEQTALSAADAGQVAVATEVAPGRNVHRQGEDVRRGDMLSRTGRRLAARDLALLGAVGIEHVEVARATRVAVMSSGAELVPCDEAVPAGGVRDVNQPALCAAVAAAGGRATRAGIVTDDPRAIADALAALVPGHDVILISGGTSVGRADHTAAALEALGARPLFHGLAIRPGRPTLAAAIGGTLIVGLPGVPSAALIVFQMFVRPLLTREECRLPARLSAAVASVRGREDYVRVAIEARSDGLWATPIPGSPSSLCALATADGVAIVPGDAEALAAGACVSVVRF
jgi:molybdopterin molybdotransferase